MFFFSTKMPDFPSVKFDWLTVIDPHESSTSVEMDCSIIRPVSVYSVDFWTLFWEEIVLEYVGSWVSRHAVVSMQGVLKPRAEAF